MADPEQKRRIIGEKFVRIFEREGKDLARVFSLRFLEPSGPAGQVAAIEERDGLGGGDGIGVGGGTEGAR